MKTELWVIGKTNEQFLQQGVDLYLKRIKKYIPFEIVEHKVPKSKNPELLKDAEKNQILKSLGKDDILILLDEKGHENSSAEFASFLQKQFNQINSRMVFLIGGAFGFHADLYKRGNNKIALSKLTFNHDLARLVFMEQLYRGLTILKNHPYHN